jgi:prepilin-type N-terminal cleavage/methylation domain-containing protein
MNLPPQGNHRTPGFTLLELCIVLFIMALLAGAATPTLRSAFAEQALRNDGSEVARLVKTGMLTSTEQQRSYVLTLEKGTLSLEAISNKDAGTDATPPGDEEADSPAPTTSKLGHDLQFHDEQTGRWASPTTVTWQFDPNGLCPVPRLRVAMGDAYLEMSFNALTGDVEDESISIP